MGHSRERAGIGASGNAEEKVALVTGAARGIELAAAMRFLDDGWHVAMLDILGGTLRAAVKAMARAEAALALEADVSDPTAVEAAVRQARQRFGRMDALVNNAGVAVFKPMLDVTLEEWQRVLAVNLTGPFLMTQAVAPIMRDQRTGVIVNITSISGLRASTLRVAYGTSKAGLAHLTKQQAAEGSAVRHPRKRRGAGTGRYRRGQGRAHPGNPGRLSRPCPAQPLQLKSELANAICFLCSDQASYITGQVLSRWTAASTPSVSACRRFGADIGINASSSITVSGTRSRR